LAFRGDRIIAIGADQTLYEERRGPTRDVLNPLFPNTPVIVYHLSEHAAFMNSEESGVILRDRFEVTVGDIAEGGYLLI